MERARKCTDWRTVRERREKEKETKTKARLTQCGNRNPLSMRIALVLEISKRAHVRRFYGVSAITVLIIDGVPGGVLKKSAGNKYTENRRIASVRCHGVAYQLEEEGVASYNI